jgi:hypothetical protein
MERLCMIATGKVLLDMALNWIQLSVDLLSGDFPVRYGHT